MSDPDVTQVSALLAELSGSGFSACEIELGDKRLRLRLPARTPAPVAAEAASGRTATGGDVGAAAGAPQGTVLKSPRVGQFYPGMGPERRGRLRPGDRLEKGEVFGTIEAMHLRYELRADLGGVIDEVLAVEGEAVEYGQPLIRLAPAGGES